MWIAVLMAVVATAAPCPEVTAEPVEDGSLLRIRHDHPQPLTAFVVEIVDYPGSRFTHVEDVLFREKIAAGQERRIKVGSLMPGTVPDYLKVTAAIYADGGTCGSGEKVKALLDERRRSLFFTRELANRVENGVSAEQIATWGAAMPPALRRVIDHVIEQLKRESPEKVAGALREVERIYVASKPAL